MLLGCSLLHRFLVHSLLLCAITGSLLHAVVVGNLQCRRNSADLLLRISCRVGILRRDLRLLQIQIVLAGSVASCSLLQLLIVLPGDLFGVLRCLHGLVQLVLRGGGLDGLVRIVVGGVVLLGAVLFRYIGDIGNRLLCGVCGGLVVLFCGMYCCSILGFIAENAFDIILYPCTLLIAFCILGHCLLDCTNAVRGIPELCTLAGCHLAAVFQLLRIFSCKVIGFLYLWIGGFTFIEIIGFLQIPVILRRIGTEYTVTSNTIVDSSCRRIRSHTDDGGASSRQE